MIDLNCRLHKLLSILQDMEEVSVYHADELTQAAENKHHKKSHMNNSLLQRYKTTVKDIKNVLVHLLGNPFRGHHSKSEEPRLGLPCGYIVRQQGEGGTHA